MPIQWAQSNEPLMSKETRLNQCQTNGQDLSLLFQRELVSY